MGRKLEKKKKKPEYIFFSISLARELLKSGHNFLNKFMSTEQHLVSPILSIKKSGVFVIFFRVYGVLWFGLLGFLLYKEAFGNGL